MNNTAKPVKMNYKLNISLRGTRTSGKTQINCPCLIKELPKVTKKMEACIVTFTSDKGQQFRHVVHGHFMLEWEEHEGWLSSVQT